METLLLFGSDLSGGKLYFFSSNFFWVLNGVDDFDSFFLFGRLERPLNKLIPLTFYGMMIIEGLIGMIWAAGGMFIYHQMPELLTGASGVKVLSILVSTVIPWAPISILVVVGVIVLAITSGDTSLRSLRLTIAELTGMEQTSVKNRLLLTVPMFAICAAIIFWSNLNPEGFNILWNYFSWSNQLMAVCSLCVATVYLRSKKKNFWIALIPCMFMTFITCDYILWVSPENLKGAPLGFGLDYKTALVIALHDAAILGFLLCTRGKYLTKMEGFDPDRWNPELDEGKVPKAR